MSGGGDLVVDVGVNGIGVTVFTYGNCEIGFSPVLIPHTYDVRYVTLDNKTAREDLYLRSPPGTNPQAALQGIIGGRLVWFIPAEQTAHANFHASHQIPIYDVRETKFTSIVGGVIVFVACRPVAAGLGLLWQGRWEVQSHRKVIKRDLQTPQQEVSGKTAAYVCDKLDPPKSLKNVRQWPDGYSKISWLQCHGVQLVAGINALAHAGVTATIEGIWRHTVERKLVVSDAFPEGVEVIKVSLSLKKQFRAGTLLGLIPFFSHRKELAHAAKTDEISFVFTGITKGSEEERVLDRLIKGNDKKAVRDAYNLSQTYSNAPNAPISFLRQKHSIEHAGKGRWRARFPLVAGKQSVNKGRDKKEAITINVGGELQQRRVKVSEKYKRKDFQYPIDSVLTEKRDRVYPNRTGIDDRRHIRWPLDYRNHTNYFSIKAYDKIQGDGVTALKIMPATMSWQVHDNYLNRNRCLSSLRHLAQKTGLGDLLLAPAEIPNFSGPATQHQHNPKESMRMQLDMQLSEECIQKIFNNVLQQDNLHGNFLDKVSDLFDSYMANPKGDYLQLAKDYPSFALYGSRNRPIVRENCRKTINKVLSKFHKITPASHHGFSLFSSHKVSDKDRRHAYRSVLNTIRKCPFVFLSAMEHVNPVLQFTFEQTSMEKIEKRVDISLALDIMRGVANTPMVATAA